MCAMDLVRNIHTDLPPPLDVTRVCMTQGEYLYYHYGCDGMDDRGWGCGYRTLQTLCSWARNRLTSAHCMKTSPQTTPAEVPSIPEIQRILVQMEDKQKCFIDSKEWIGSVEVGLVVDLLYDIPCKLIHIENGSLIQGHVDTLCSHFETIGSPIMMGGDSDASSKGIIGVAAGQNTSYLLILDPHYYGKTPTQATLVDKNMLQWRPTTSFMENSFYNLCLPQYKLPT